MSRIVSFISTLQSSLSQVLFPNVCLCCGQTLPHNNRHICDFCLHKRFDDANPENEESSGGIILPRRVTMQHALWNFDKGGMLQNLMHHLKYDRLTGVGTQLGEVLGRRAKRHPGIYHKITNCQTILLPVPLHYLKFRKRGFNQAFYIARGIENMLKIPICSIDAVVRKKYTRSQTGFTLEKRIENMKDAFKVKKPALIKSKLVIIIDDVFTTGSTTFELAKTVLQSGAESVMIWTIAQA